MMRIGLGTLVSLALLACFAPACASAQGYRTATEARRLPGVAVVVPPVPVVHGTWTRGPGTYEFTACTSGCNINASPGQSVPLTIEVWGGGGGGGSGAPYFIGTGSGGGGGGGGGYGKAVIMVVIPISDIAIYNVRVGGGGGKADPYWAGGKPSGSTHGEDGVLTSVTAPNGSVLVHANGGKGGAGGDGLGCVRCGGASGSGMPNGWGGTAGYPGSLGNTCNGGGGGLGGAGGGPGRSGPGYVNDGGKGGSGGNVRDLPKCRGTTNEQLESGYQGGDGKVVLSW